MLDPGYEIELQCQVVDCERKGVLWECKDGTIVLCIAHYWAAVNYVRQERLNARMTRGDA